MGFPDYLNQALATQKISPSIGKILHRFYESYAKALKGKNLESQQQVLIDFLDQAAAQIQNPFNFPLFHKKIREPFDYYAMGLDLLRPLIDFSKSSVRNLEYLETQLHLLEKKENVIFFANHQTEPDPQIISLLLEHIAPKFAEEMVFVAGHRVISDPLAVPFSKGRNLLCIYSKRHIETPPDQKAAKLSHNQATMQKMGELLSEGGYCIYVAPSGGRDRPNAEGVVEVAPFDPQSIELFYLIASQAKRPTHFYPLTLSTYALLPPPNSIEMDLGEERIAETAPVHLAFGPEIDMDNIPGISTNDKKEKRKKRTEYIWNLVKMEYDTFDQIKG